MDTFYCGSCSRHKAVALKIEDPGHRPVCKSCHEKMEAIRNKGQFAENSRLRAGKFNQKSYSRGIPIYFTEDK